MSFLRQGSVLLDVGCDHGKVAIAALSRGICARAIASDINQGPLATAKANAARCLPPSADITFVCCDGIPSISLEGHVDIVIAGMGGDNIVEILTPFFESGVAKSTRFILLPHTKQPELRTFLSEHGLRIVDEAIVRDTQRLYQVIVAETECDSAGSEQLARAQLLLGPRNIERGGDNLTVLARFLHSVNITAANGRRAAGLDAAEQDRDIEELRGFC